MRRFAVVLALAGCGRFGFRPGEAMSNGDAAADAVVAVDGSPAVTDAAVPTPDAAVAIDAPPGPITLPGLLAHYAMNDDPALGAIASDQLPATCTAACPTATPGRYDGGYHFDGTQYVDLPSTTLVGITPYTVAVWLKLDVYPAAGSGAPLVAKPQDTGQADTFNLLVLGSSTSMETTADGAASDYLGSPLGFSLGEWRHVAATWDGTTKRLYQGGALVGSEVAPLVDSTQLVSIGVDRDGGVAAFHLTGSLDELQFYGRALSDQEIQTLAQ